MLQTYRAHSIRVSSKFLSLYFVLTKDEIIVYFQLLIRKDREASNEIQNKKRKTQLI
jgi:hypothetical protein